MALCTSRRARSGFSLIELLVTIAIISLLVAILMPALSNARKVAAMTRELANGHQMTGIYNNYAMDFKDLVVNASGSWQVVRADCPAPPHHRIKAPSPFDPGKFIDGDLCKVWFYYLHGWAGTPMHATQIDRSTFENFNGRSMSPRSYSGYAGWIAYSDNTKPAAFAFHPTLGLNGIYVGGSYRHGGLMGQWGVGNGHSSSGEFYVSRLHQVRDPSALSIFMSTRGGDVTSTTFWGYAANAPNSGVIRPGYFLATPPRGTPAFPSTWTMNTAADAIYNEKSVPSTYGNVAFRHFNKAVVTSMDGHAQMRSIAEMRDIRLWDNWADAPNAPFRPRR